MTPAPLEKSLYISSRDTLISPQENTHTHTKHKSNARQGSARL